MVQPSRKMWVALVRPCIPRRYVVASMPPMSHCHHGTPLLVAAGAVQEVENAFDFGRVRLALFEASAAVKCL